MLNSRNLQDMKKTQALNTSEKTSPFSNEHLFFDETLNHFTTKSPENSGEKPEEKNVPEISDTAREEISNVMSFKNNLFAISDSSFVCFLISLFKVVSLLFFSNKSSS